MTAEGEFLPSLPNYLMAGGNRSPYGSKSAYGKIIAIMHIFRDSILHRHQLVFQLAGFLPEKLPRLIGIWIRKQSSNTLF